MVFNSVHAVAAAPMPIPSTIRDRSGKSLLDLLRLLLIALLIPYGRQGAQAHGPKSRE